MGDVSEEDSDVELSQEEILKKTKKKYIHQTRDVSSATSSKTKKLKLKKLNGEEEDEDDDMDMYDEKKLNDEEDDEEYFKKFVKNEIEYQEDDLERQLRFEREEKERKEQMKKDDAEKAEPIKTKIDPDGTEYEWDPAIKGWFPKVPIFVFFPKFVFLNLYSLHLNRFL